MPNSDPSFFPSELLTTIFLPRTKKVAAILLSVATLERLFFYSEEERRPPYAFLWTAGKCLLLAAGVGAWATHNELEHLRLEAR